MHGASIGGGGGGGGGAEDARLVEIVRYRTQRKRTLAAVDDVLGAVARAPPPPRTPWAGAAGAVVLVLVLIIAAAWGWRGRAAAKRGKAPKRAKRA